jgi:hypothetical protein
MRKPFRTSMKDQGDNADDVGAGGFTGGSQTARQLCGFSDAGEKSR